MSVMGDVALRQFSAHSIVIVIVIVIVIAFS